VPGGLPGLFLQGCVFFRMAAFLADPFFPFRTKICSWGAGHRNAGLFRCRTFFHGRTSRRNQRTVRGRKPKPLREVLPKKGGQRDLKERRPSSPGSRTVRSRRKRRGVPDRFPPPRRQGPGGRPDRFSGFNRCRFGILGSATLKISIRPGCSPFHRAPGNRHRCPACRG